MKFYHSFLDDAIRVQARMESDDGMIVGDFSTEVKEGGTIFGKSYDELKSAARTTGVIEIGDEG